MRSFFSQRCHATGSAKKDRRAFLLPLVLAVLACVIPIAYHFLGEMMSSVQRASVEADTARASDAALSGIRLSMIWLQSRDASRRMPRELRDPLPGQVPLPTADDKSVQVRLLAPAWSPAPYGLENESAKLSVNSLPLVKESQRQSREILMHLPGMTPQTADAILDWIDGDEEPREFGAERSYYTAIGLHPPRNRRLASLDDLLQVRGVTPELLYGNDLNRDGLLDPNESSDSERVYFGWSQFLTTDARESNLRSDGSAKIFLNDEHAEQIYDALRRVLPAEQALFIAALRRFGPHQDPGDMSGGETEEDRRATADLRAAQQSRVATPNASAADDGKKKPNANTSRDGVDLGGNAIFRIRSICDLCGTKVRIQRNNQEAMLRSPWADDAAGARAAFHLLEPLVTCFDGTAVEGRIDLNEAAWPILTAIPGLNLNQARAIESRARTLFGMNANASLVERDPVWILEQGLVDWKTFRKIAPMLTSGGDVYTVRSLGSARNDRVFELVTARLDRALGTVEIIFRTSQPTSRIVTSLPATNRSLSSR